MSVSLSMLVVACGLALVLGAVFVSGPRTSQEAALPASSEVPSARPVRGQEQVLPTELGGRRVGLSFELPPGADVAMSNDYMLELGWPDGPYLELWWRVGGVIGDPCPALDAIPDRPRTRVDPSPAETYDLIRSASIFDVASEVPFAFAGATGRAVEITLRADAQARCGASFILTGAGKGYQAAHITFPADGAMRLAVVEVGGHELLLAITGSSVSELDRWDATLDTFQAEVGPDPASASAEPPISTFEPTGSMSMPRSGAVALVPQADS